MPRVRAAFMRGSFYSGQPDAYSGLDLYIVAENTVGEELIALGRDVLDATGQILWISVIDGIPARLRALASGPVRIDLAIVTPTTLPTYEGWRILLDHDKLLRDRALRAQA